MKAYSPSYSITARLRYADFPGALGSITSTIGKMNGQIGAVDIVDVRQDTITRDITISAGDVDHGQRIVEALKQLDGVEVLKTSDRSTKTRTRPST